MTVALFGEDDGSVTIGHVGDSRAYLLRDGRLEQLTDDHSLVAELVRRGELSPDEAEVHPQRSVITRALGTDPDVDVDTFSIDGAARATSSCSARDGLTTMVDADEIAELVLAATATTSRPTRALIAGGERPRRRRQHHRRPVRGRRGGDRAGATRAAAPDAVVAARPPRPTSRTRCIPEDGVRAAAVAPRTPVATPPPADDTVRRAGADSHGRCRSRPATSSRPATHRGSPADAELRARHAPEAERGRRAAAASALAQALALLVIVAARRR